MGKMDFTDGEIGKNMIHTFYDHTLTIRFIIIDIDSMSWSLTFQHYDDFGIAQILTDC
jgi:hypothetical protein